MFVVVCANVLLYVLVCACVCVCVLPCLLLLCVGECCTRDGLCLRVFVCG